MINGCCDRNAAGARADVQNTRRRHRFGDIEQLNHQSLGIGPRNEHGRCHAEIESEEFAVPHEVGNRLGLRAAADQIPHRRSLFLREHFVKPRVQLDPTTAPRLSQQDFGIEPGSIAAVLFEMGRGPVDDPADCPLIARCGSAGSCHSCHGRFREISAVAAPLCRRSCRSNSTSAPTSSSRSPCITWSILCSVRPMR